MYDEKYYPALNALGSFNFSLIDSALKRLNAVASILLDLERLVREVEEQGIVDAKPHWKDGKYLYLIHPMKDGERMREYVGADESKIQVALCKIENKARHKILSEQLATARRQYSQLEYDLSYILRRVANNNR